MVIAQKPKEKLIITKLKTSQPPFEKVKGSPSKKRKPIEIPHKVIQGKPRRKLAQEKEEDDERIKSNEPNTLKIVKRLS